MVFSEERDASAAFVVFGNGFGGFVALKMSRMSNIQETSRVGDGCRGVVSKQTLGSQLITGTMGGLILSGWAGTPADRRHRAPELLATAGEAELRRNGGLINSVECSPTTHAFT